MFPPTDIGAGVSRWMFGQRLRVGAIDDLPGLICFLGRAMNNHDKLAALKCRLVLCNTIFVDTQTLESVTQHTQTAHHHATFQCPDYHAD